MPLYLYTCHRCKRTRSDMRTINERHDAPFCDCGNKMILTPAPVAGIVKNPAVPRKS